MSAKPQEHAQILTDDEVSALLLAGVIVTRQAIDPQPPSVDAVKAACGAQFSLYQPPGRSLWVVAGPVESVRRLMGCEPQWLCPLGAAGGSVYVQEAWYCDDYRCQEAPYPEPPDWREHGMMYYHEDDPALHFDGDEGEVPWHPAESMPAWAARIWLRIDEVRIERIDGVWMWARKCVVVSTTERPAEVTAHWTPTLKEANDCGDVLLEALIASNLFGNREPMPGDLVFVPMLPGLDWERVGYLLSAPDADPIRLWSVGRRVVRWHNASVRLIAYPGGRPIRYLRSLQPPPAVAMLWAYGSEGAAQ